MIVSSEMTYITTTDLILLVRCWSGCKTGTSGGLLWIVWFVISLWALDQWPDSRYYKFEELAADRLQACLAFPLPHLNEWNGCSDSRSREKGSYLNWQLYAIFYIRPGKLLATFRLGSSERRLSYALYYVTSGFTYGCTAKQPRSELFFNKSWKQIGNINAIT